MIATGRVAPLLDLTCGYTRRYIKNKKDLLRQTVLYYSYYTGTGAGLFYSTDTILGLYGLTPSLTAFYSSTV